jgi:glyceraldehyde 3-phosphate dehydrogenase
MPELKGKIDGISLRVPVPDVSIVDLTAVLKKNVTKESINAAFKKAAEGSLKNILAYTEEPIVSTDVLHTTYSGVFDALSTMVIENNFVKLLIWYDNEWGFSCRMVEQIEMIAKKEGL